MARHRWTDDEIVAVGRKYQHKGDWKRSSDRLDSAAYQSALNRPEVFLQATAHMTPKASPYSGSYVVYAYEFSDHYAYVGLTFIPRIRHSLHMQRGPVHDHIQLCQNYQHKIVEQGIANPAEARLSERRWMQSYIDGGWTLLNTAKGGGLGTVQITKWTKEAVMAEARKYKTRQEWIKNSQFTYRLAKRAGWFDEASAHMPKRVLGIGAGVKFSNEHKQKLAVAAQARAADPAWQAAHSARLKGRVLSQAHRDAIKRGMAKHPLPPPPV